MSLQKNYVKLSIDIFTHANNLFWSKIDRYPMIITGSLLSWKNVDLTECTISKIVSAVSRNTSRNVLFNEVVLTIPIDIRVFLLPTIESRPTLQSTGTNYPQGNLRCSNSLPEIRVHETSQASRCTKRPRERFSRKNDIELTCLSLERARAHARLNSFYFSEAFANLLLIAACRAPSRHNHNNSLIQSRQKVPPRPNLI